MTVNRAMFSSKDTAWATPQALVDGLALIYAGHPAFDLDVCATPETAKAPHYFTPDDDGLAQEWRGFCWMNPPYGREIGKWVRKAWQEGQREGTTVVCLVPCRTDTSWWTEYVTKAESIIYMRGRIRFGGSSAGAPFPTAIVVFR